MEQFCIGDIAFMYVFTADREEAGEGGGEEGEAALDPLTDMYEDLPPLEKLERYFQSEDVLDRLNHV